MHYSETDSSSPYFNLALEETLLAEETPLPGSGCFLLWQNAASVIIGRHQNALSEVNLTALREKNVTLARRMTGGGAVYHDFGNLNFTFIVTDSANEHEKLLRPLLAVLGDAGVPAKGEGRNDLVIPGAGKFSGLASRRVRGKFLLHGTLLYDVDLNTLEQVLRVDSEKFKSKGVVSVRKRVANLKDHLHLSLRELWHGIRDAYDFPRWSVPEAIREKAQRLVAEKYSLDRWNLGVSPPGDVFLKRRFAFGSLELHLETKRNKITAAKITGDFLLPESISEATLEPLENALLNLPADHPQSWADAWSLFELHEFFHGCTEPETENVLQWLAHEAIQMTFFK